MRRWPRIGQVTRHHEAFYGPSQPTGEDAGEKVAAEVAAPGQGQAPVATAPYQPFDA